MSTLRESPRRSVERWSRRVVSVGLLSAGSLLGCSSQVEGAAPPTAELPDVRLIDHRGRSWTPQELLGDWTLIFFGFTRCPQICPLTLRQTVAVREVLEQRGVEPPRVLLVSVDPEHDTPRRLERYLETFGPDYVGLTGAEDGVLGLERWLGAAHRAADRPDSPSGPIDHSGYLYLIGPDAGLRARVQGVDGAEQIADRLLQSM